MEQSPCPWAMEPSLCLCAREEQVSQRYIITEPMHTMLSSSLSHIIMPDIQNNEEKNDEAEEMLFVAGRTGNVLTFCSLSPCCDVLFLI